MAHRETEMTSLVQGRDDTNYYGTQGEHDQGHGHGGGHGHGHRHGHEEESILANVHSWRDLMNIRLLLTILLSRRVVKTIVVLCFMVVALYFFTTTRTVSNLEALKSSPEDHIENEILAIDSMNPHYYYLVHEPIEVIHIVLSSQELKENQTLHVELQGQNANSTWNTLDFYEVKKIRSGKITADHEFDVTHELKDVYSHFRVAIQTNTEEPLGITFKLVQLYELVKGQVFFAALILGGVYFFIVFEVLHRTIVAMLGSFICLGVLSALREKPSFEEVISWIDFETVGLLFGMMLMVGIFAKSGFFEYSAVKAYKIAKGQVWYLVVILCLFTAIVSAFLDNVTTVLLITPVCIRLCNVMSVDPIPILLSIVLFSNIGGTLTPIGDPPNIIIVNHPDIRADGTVTFGSFTIHMLPGVAASLAVLMLYVKLVYGKQFVSRHVDPKKKEIDLWKRTESKIVGDSEEAMRVKERLQSFILSLESGGDRVEEGGDTKPAQGEMVGGVDITALEAQYPIKDMSLCIHSSVVLTGVILAFFLRSGIELDLTLAWIAIIGAMILLLISGIKEIDEVLEKVEWGTLLFFAALFVLMHGLEELGLVGFIGDRTADIISAVPEGKGRLAVAIVLILWISAICSAFIDNIPYTTTMVPVIIKLSTLNLPLQPLVWALAFGACFGGNGTLIGASANVVVAGIAEQNGYPITFNTFFKAGFPVMILTMIVCTIYLLIVHVAFEWH